MAQSWLNRRLDGLFPIDFEESVRVYCLANLTPPPEFEKVWEAYDGRDGAIPELSEEDIATLNAIIILASPVEPAQVFALRQLITVIDAWGHDVPPMFWVPHTVAPEERPANAVVDSTRDNLANNVLELGLDAIVAGEPEGYALALAVRAKIHKTAVLSATMNSMVNQRRKRARQAEFMQQSIHCILWDYLRMRLAPAIPPVDFQLPPGHPQQLGNLIVGPMIGRGSKGAVYRLESLDARPQGSAGHFEVLKVLDKVHLKGIKELVLLKRTIDVMRMLSSEQWRHPNVVQLFHVYHSPSCILIRMEFAGTENLYSRLMSRQHPANPRPLSFTKTASLVSQAINVVTYLHLGPHVCHRDLKPENMIVRESAHSISMKLIDFDLACTLEQGSLCRGACGTVPFAAPEVMLDQEYDGAAADIWSLGIVLLEILGGMRVVEEAVGLLELAPLGSNHSARLAPSPGMAELLRTAFAEQNASAILQKHCFRDLWALVPVVGQLLDGMLKGNAEERWDAEQIAAQAENMSRAPPRPAAP